MVIRPETPADYSQIADITYEAFSAWKPRPFAPSHLSRRHALRPVL